jgi:hypothetical protein
MPVASAGPYWRAIYVMPSLFISHSHRDEAEVLRLRDRMGQQGVTSLFLQYGIPAGAKWEAELHSQLRRCDAVLFVGRPASVASRECFSELAMARSLGKTIIPATIAPEGQHPLLADTQAIDLAAADGQGRLGERLVCADLDPVGRAGLWVRAEERVDELCRRLSYAAEGSGGRARRVPSAGFWRWRRARWSAESAEAVEVGEDLVRRLVAAWRRGGWGQEGERAFLDGHVGVDVLLC